MCELYIFNLMDWEPNTGTGWPRPPPYAVTSYSRRHQWVGSWLVLVLYRTQRLYWTVLYCTVLLLIHTGVEILLMAFSLLPLPLSKCGFSTTLSVPPDHMCVRQDPCCNTCFPFLSLSLQPVTAETTTGMNVMAIAACWHSCYVGREVGISFSSPSRETGAPILGL